MNKSKRSNFSAVNFGTISKPVEVSFYGLGLIGNQDNNVAMYNTSDSSGTTLTPTDWSQVTFNPSGEELNNASQENIKLFVSDSESNILNCKSAGGSLVSCCKNDKDLVEWNQTKSGNSFSCQHVGQFDPNTPYPGHYKCLASADEGGNKYYKRKNDHR